MGTSPPMVGNAIGANEVLGAGMDELASRGSRATQLEGDGKGRADVGGSTAARSTAARFISVSSASSKGDIPIKSSPSTDALVPSAVFAGTLLAC